VKNFGVMIDPAAFLERLNRVKAIHEKLAGALTAGLGINRFDAQETFLSPSHCSHSMYYIESGLIRGVVDSPSKKRTTWFCRDHDILLPQGLFSQKPGREYVSAVTKTTLLALPLRHLQKVMADFPEAAELVILLASEAARQAQYREYLLRIPAAKDRYAYLAEHEAYLLKIAPHYLIASYLNVSTETFSRLHKGLTY
jgi:CRP-like cAMP-binding protein